MKEARAELVRIDATGLAHPIGMVASQRMRSREGAFRVLPGPKHVVFMRYTGEDGRRDLEDGSVVRLAGEITAPAAVSDILSLVGQTGWRGELVVMDGESTRCIFVDQGNVVGAETNVKREYLGEVLYKFGAIGRAEHEQIVAQLGGGKRYGELAAELGILTRDKVYEFLGRQIQEIVFASLTVGDGTFYFLDGFAESRVVTHHAMSASSLLMDAITRLDEIRYFSQKIPTPLHIPARLEGRTAPGPDLSWIYLQIDGKRSVAELGRATGRGEFETTKAIFALVQGKHVVIRPPPLTGGPVALVTAANDALAAILGAADAAGRGTALRANLAGFAGGAGIYDVLFRGAGPDERGKFKAEVVAENAKRIAGGADAVDDLMQLLHDYVSFALFSAGSTLGSAKEAELTRDVGAALSQLLPQSSA
ncbi:MAG: DUF4388 domain-containing protein [Myxococcales bacterium]|nr:DUF4388 domain-containing protein [Myxococcales bacterium]